MLQPRSALAWFVFGFLHLLVCVTTTRTFAREVTVLNFVYMTERNQQLVNNFDLISSNLLFPIAIKHFNERYGGIVPDVLNYRNCNVTLRLANSTMHDTQGLSSIAVSTYFKSLESGPLDVVLGGATAEVSRALALTVGAMHIPMVSHIVVDDALSDKAAYPTFFRMTSTMVQYAESLARLLVFRDIKNVGMIHGTAVTQASLRESIEHVFAKYGIRVLFRVYDSNAKDEDLRASLRLAMRGIIQARLNVVLHSMLSLEYLWAMSEVAMNFNYIDNKMHLLQISFSAVADLAGAPNTTALKKFLHGSFQLSGGYRQGNQALQRLTKHWFSFNFEQDVLPVLPPNVRDRFPLDYFQRPTPQSPYRYRSWTNAYDAVMAIGIAACQAGNNTKPGWLQSSLRNVRVDGTSGEVAFDENLDRESKLIDFSLENVLVENDSLVWLEVAKSDNGNWSVLRDLTFGGGSTAQPVDVTPPPHEIQVLPLTAVIVGGIESGIILLASVFVLYKFTPVCRLVGRQDDALLLKRRPWREEPQTEFLILLLIGCILMGISIVALILESDTGCMLFNWTFALGFLLALCCLSARAFNFSVMAREATSQTSTSLQEAIASARFKSLAGLSAVVLLMALLLALWQGLSPMEFQITIEKTDEQGNPLVSSQVCTMPTTTSTVFFALVPCFYGLAMIATVVITFRIRHLPTSFREARLTMIAALCMFQVFFIAIPAAAAVWIDPLPRFLVLSSLAFLLSAIILVTIFFSRLLNWKFSAINFLSPSISQVGRGGSNAEAVSRNSSNDPTHSKGEPQTLSEIPTHASNAENAHSSHSRTNQDMITELRMRRRHAVIQAITSNNNNNSNSSPANPPVRNHAPRLVHQQSSALFDPLASDTVRNASNMMQGIRPAMETPQYIEAFGEPPLALASSSNGKSEQEEEHSLHGMEDEHSGIIPPQYLFGGSIAMT